MERARCFSTAIYMHTCRRLERRLAHAKQDWWVDASGCRSHYQQGSGEGIVAREAGYRLQGFLTHIHTYSVWLPTQSHFHSSCFLYTLFPDWPLLGCCYNPSAISFHVPLQVFGFSAGMTAACCVSIVFYCQIHMTRSKWPHLHLYWEMINRGVRCAGGPAGGLQ